MKSVVVVGAQWGDEGKGKVVDYLSGSFDYIARDAGGHNAGHTVIIGKDRFVRSEEHTSESSHSQISYAVFCLKKKKKIKQRHYCIVTYCKQRDYNVY